MAYGMKTKEEALKDLNAGIPVEEVSLKYGVSVSTLYKWKSNASTNTKPSSEEIDIEHQIEEKDTNLDRQEFLLKNLGQEVTRKDPEQEPSKIKELPVLSKSERHKQKEQQEELIKEIKQLTEANRLEEALELCNDPLAEDNTIIQSQKISILIRLGTKVYRNGRKEYLEEALEVCRNYSGLRKDFAEREQTILFYLGEAARKKEERKAASNRHLDHWITKIYCDCLEEEELKNSEIDPWHMDILLAAYYEKERRGQIVSHLKGLKKKYQEDSEKLRVLNNIMERTSTKKLSFFDIANYTRILGCRVRFELIPALKEEKAAKEAKEIEERRNKMITIQTNKEVPEKIMRTSKEKTEKKMIVVEGERTTPRYNNPMNRQSTVVSEEEAAPDLSIGEVFASEVLEIGRAAYAQMTQPEKRMPGAEALDRLEILKERSSNDVEALRDMIDLINRINAITPGFIKTNEERNKQMLKKYEQKN